MELGKNNPLMRFKHLFIIYGAIIVVVLLVFFTNVFETKQAGAMPPFVWLLVAILFMIPLMLIFATLMKMLDIVDDSNSKMPRCRSLRVLFGSDRLAESRTPAEGAFVRA